MISRWPTACRCARSATRTPRRPAQGRPGHGRPRHLRLHELRPRPLGDDDRGFAVDLTVHAIRGGKVIADGAIPGSTPMQPMFASPFLADGHLVLLTQFDHSQPGMCQPNAFGAIHVSRYDHLFLAVPGWL